MIYWIDFEEYQHHQRFYGLNGIEKEDNTKEKEESFNINLNNNKMNKDKVIFKSADTGAFVTEEFAKANPKTTYKTTAKKEEDKKNSVGTENPKLGNSDFLTRLVLEQENMQKKVDKLEEFLGKRDTKIPKEQNVLLVQQLFHMKKYNECLIDRLELLKKI